MLWYHGWMMARPRDWVIKAGLIISVTTKHAAANMHSQRTLAANQRQVSKSRDHSRPIRGQYPGHVITLDQSEASIQVAWSLSTNQRLVSRSRDHSRPIRGQYAQSEDTHMGNVCLCDPACSYRRQEEVFTRYWYLSISGSLDACLIELCCQHRRIWNCKQLLEWTLG